MNTEQPVKRPPWRPREYDLEELANELLDWSKGSDSINLTQFVAKKEIPVEYISRWTKQSKYFCQVLNMAKVNIGLNRQKKALESLLTQDEFKRHEYRYDPFYRKDERKEFAYRENVKKKTAQHNEQMTIRELAKAVIDEQDRSH